MTEQLELLLARLKEQGYVEAVQVLWASSTSDVPFNWETEGQLSLVEDSAPPENQLASFQVRPLATRCKPPPAGHLYCLARNCVRQLFVVCLPCNFTARVAFAYISPSS